MSASSQQGSREEVFPGAKLGVVEEYLPGEGVYIDAMGHLRASVLGVAVRDESRRSISVRPRRLRKLPQAGSTVLALVTNIRPDLVVATLYGIAEFDRRGALTVVRDLPGRFIGAIPIAQVADERIKDIYDYFRIGDIILAQTLNSSNPYTLSTKTPRHGVVFATCARCGHPLEPVSDRQMRCPRCGHVEARKVSNLAPIPKEKLRLRRWLLVPHRL